MSELVLSAPPPKNEKLYKARGHNGFYGLIDANGKLIKDFKYRNIGEFHCGYALISQNIESSNVRQGFVNSIGNIAWLTKPYSEVCSFSENRALVTRFYGYNKNMHGFIDLNFNEIIPLIYFDAHEFKSGLARVMNNEGRWGFIDIHGNQVIPFNYEYVGDFYGDLALFRIGEYPKYKYGFINKNGKEIIPAIYDEAKYFNEGLAAVCKKSDDGFYWGYIDKNGEYAILPQFWEATSFNEGKAIVSLDYGEYFIIDKNNTKQSCVFSGNQFDTFTNGVSYMSSKYDDKIGIVNQKGSIILEPIYSRIFGNEGNYYIVELCENNKFEEFYLLDKNGIRLNLIPYNEIFSFVEGFAVVKKYEHIPDKVGYCKPVYGFIDIHGKEIVKCMYDDVEVFRNGVAALKKSNTWRLIDKNGKFIGDNQFENICLFNKDGFIYPINQYKNILTDTASLPDNLYFFRRTIGFVVQNGKYGIINREGKMITQCLFDAFILANNPTNNDIIIYKTGEKFGYINTRNGNTISPPIFWNAFSFSDGLAACCYDGKWGFIDEFGETVIPFQYFQVGSFKFGLAAVNIDNKWGFVDKYNNIIVKCKYPYIIEDFAMVANISEPVAIVGVMTEKYQNRLTHMLINKKGTILDDDLY